LLVSRRLSGRPAIAPPSPSVIAIGRQRDTAPSAAAMKPRCSSPVPTRLEWVMRG